MTIGFEDFLKVDMRVGRIIRAESFPEARKPAYKLFIDFGPLGVRKTSAQITGVYSVDELAGRLVVAVVNFPPKQIASFMSEVLVLGADDEEGRIVLLEPERNIPLGKRVY
jgi:tRNA-binding protein